MTIKRTLPETTLFLNLSVDGRITSHDSDLFDPDSTWKQTPGIRSVLQQFYDFNQPNMVALTTGFLMKNLGVNTRVGHPKREDLTLIVLDPDNDLTKQGITYLSQNVKHLYFVSLKPLKLNIQNLTILTYKEEVDLNHLFKELYTTYKIKKVFIHSISPLNAALLDAGLITHLSVIISPLLVGDHGTPALPNSLHLSLRTLKLIESQSFSQNYISLQYEVTT